MFQGLSRRIKAGIYQFFVKFDESLESRYDTRIREAEEQFNKIESYLKKNPSEDYKALVSSFETVSQATRTLNEQNRHIILLIESQFPEMTGRFSNINEAITYLIKRYHEAKEVGISNGHP